MFFDNTFGIIRVLVAGSLAYVALILMLRISGKRTLAKMNAFDLIVTVSLGSTLATVLLSNDIALVEGLSALALLILMQFVVTWFSVRIGFVRRLVKSSPRVLLLRGQFVQDALREERYTEEEVEAAVRGGGVGSLGEVEAVILETDGSMSVIRRGETPATALTSVRGYYSVGTALPAGP